MKTCLFDRAPGARDRRGDRSILVTLVGVLLVFSGSEKLGDAKLRAQRQIIQQLREKVRSSAAEATSSTRH